MTFRHLFLAASVICATSCGSGPSVEPTPVIEDPTVACPSDVSVTAHSGQLPTVSFDTPTASKGSAPVTVVCTPASGTQFPNGTTMVTCEATDARAHKGSCTFTVTVAPVPQLLKTRFLAFGDSITEGKTTLIGPSVVIVGSCPPSPSNPSGVCFNNGPSYVEQLSAKMSVRYQDQTVTIIAEGLGNEEAGEGKLRLLQVLPMYNPDALLLLEGTNDLLHTTDPAKLQGAINSIVDALRVMVVAARSRGVKVYVGTLPPLSPVRQPDQAAAVPRVNVLIESMASQESATLVDLNAAITLDMHGSDGIHLKPEGYAVMADTWMKAVQATLEVKTTVSP